jgi:hypothetical protein
MRTIAEFTKTTLIGRLQIPVDSAWASVFYMTQQAVGYRRPPLDLNQGSNAPSSLFLVGRRQGHKNAK